MISLPDDRSLGKPVIRSTTFRAQAVSMAPRPIVIGRKSPDRPGSTIRTAECPVVPG